MKSRFVALGMLTALTFCVCAPAGRADDERETPLVKAVKRASSSVVNIHTEKTAAAERPVFPAGDSKARKINGMGTGVVIDERGYIITNYHVIADVELIRASFDDGSDYSAAVIAFDRDHDLAVIKVESGRSLKVLANGTSSDLMLGESVIAIGNAFGYEHTVTAGIISALHRNVEVNADQSYKNLIQTDTAINPGNSGGPLLNLRGELVAINVAIRAGAQKIGFAIPIDDARLVMAKLMSVESLSQTQHGLITRDVKNATTRKLLIEGTKPDSPAAVAGLKSGDIVQKVADRDVIDLVDLERALLGRPAGDKVSVVVSRGDKTETLSLSLTPFTAGRSRLGNEIVVRGNNDTTEQERVWKLVGLRLAPLPADRRGQLPTGYTGGMIVTEVRPQSAAQLNGIKRDDVLVGLRDFETLTYDNISWILKQPIPAGEAVKYRVLRANQIYYGAVTLPAERVAEIPTK